jgi:hypothetical protein
MKPAAVAVAAAILLTISGCHHHRPSASWSNPGSGLRTVSGLYANFSATARSPENTSRIRGQLAVSSNGRMRVEIPGPGGSLRFFLVAGRESLTVIIGSERIFYSDEPDAPIIEALFNLDVQVEVIAGLISGELKPLAPGCRASAHRWKKRPGGESVPGRLILQCGDTNLKLRLSNHMEIGSGEMERLFAPLRLLPGYSPVNRTELVSRIGDISGR